MSGNRRINHQIKAPVVSLVLPDGKMKGDVQISEAIKIADQMGLDLVEVSPSHKRSNPPVCKVIDYGKMKYNETKKQKHNHHESVVKEIKVGMNTSEHDLQYKHRHIREFFEKKYKVKYTLELKGRERYRPEEAENQLRENLEDFSDVAKVGSIQKSARSLTVMLTPYY